MGARMVVHGHHHDSLNCRSEWPKLEFEAHCVAFRSIMAIDGSVICEGLVSARCGKLLGHSHRRFGLEETGCIVARPSVLSLQGKGELGNCACYSSWAEVSA